MKWGRAIAGGGVVVLVGVLGSLGGSYALQHSGQSALSSENPVVNPNPPQLTFPEPTQSTSEQPTGEPTGQPSGEQTAATGETPGTTASGVATEDNGNSGTDPITIPQGNQDTNNPEPTQSNGQPTGEPTTSQLPSTSETPDSHTSKPEPTKTARTNEPTATPTRTHKRDGGGTHSPRPTNTETQSPEYHGSRTPTPTPTPSGGPADD